ncbi:hypothetical protein CA54_57940 [Symmachiella macrocystis]|uniref:Uncharacterized protein n=1 Tax=Symmachiella macrocystis TaxID=2527985 RepID=A0A5C6B611_9PLAN|nr:hypothetical protein [Symmachiella macrocystis]TWU07388.1 hypothetical protein CA54_57940 [Symmachiella macrocystis]
MQWRQEPGGVLMADAPHGASIKECMEELFEYIESYLIPKNASVDCSYIRVEIWFDSGDIVVYPASLNTRERREKAVCLVTFADLLERSDELLDTLEARQANGDLKEGDELFDSIAREEIKKWASFQPVSKPL